MRRVRRDIVAVPALPPFLAIARPGLSCRVAGVAGGEVATEIVHRLDDQGVETVEAPMVAC
ncbi:hypothetical protein ACFQ07_02000, partial [Actinomadura adrarensis]